MEVVVGVHAARTTTSEDEARFGIMTCSKRKLITPEIPDPPCNIQEVVVVTLYQRI
jgi:hypothetical protein